MAAELKPGQFLHATCSDLYYEILKVYKDQNGADVIDLDVPDINEFINSRWDDLYKNGQPSLLVVEPKHAIFKQLQYDIKEFDTHTSVRCNTPGNGCFRCQEGFILKDKAS